MGLVIRDARPDDARAVADVALEVWPATYAGLLEDAFIADVLAHTYSVESLTRLISSAPVFLVAERDGGAVGYLHYGSGVHGPELHRLYLRESETGRGTGRALLAELNARLEPGDSYVALVHEGNERALGFYERMGFEPAGRVDGRSLYLEREGVVPERDYAAGCDVLVRFVVPGA
ncbi:MAG TPA: GNAT family N-acetyltransferase [Thermoleophilaceae bacterium]|nr:GNAT family N-acetyltransferase [Thermoleophilaceae bacterium]